MFKRYLLLGATASALLSAASQYDGSTIRLVFEPNRGQAGPEVRWIARGPGYRLMLTEHGATIAFSEPGAGNNMPRSAHASRTARTSVIGMSLTGSHAWNHVAGLQLTGGVSNYLIGNDPKRWHAGVPQYARLRVDGVYDGVDLVFYSGPSGLEYDFELAPHADPRQIRLAFDGAKDLRVEKSSGDLLLTTALGAQIRHMRPKIYQTIGGARVDIAGGYHLLDARRVRFTLAAYDSNRSLIIDPNVVFTRFLAGSNEDVATSIAVDSSGNSYVTGYTLSTNLPTFSEICWLGMFCSIQYDQPGMDAFMTKLSPQGQILFSTYLGGSGDDRGEAIAADSTGIYITGNTSSPNFPTLFSLQPYRGGGDPYNQGDAFLTKLTTDGSLLVYSTYLGGSNYDHAFGIAVDSSHAVYIAGETWSSDFPLSNPMQSHFGGGVSDGFVTKVAASGSYLQYSTYLGGSRSDLGYAIAVDTTGHAYVAGQTQSSDFHTTLPAIGATPQGGGYDTFVTKLDPSGAFPTFSLYLGGGDSFELAKSIAIDGLGNSYITGFTSSNHFPVTPGVIGSSKNSAYHPAGFATKLSSSGALLSSTYIDSPTGDTEGNRIAVNSAGAIYVAGGTSGTSFLGQLIRPNPSAGFLIKLSSNMRRLGFVTFLGAEIQGLAFPPTARFDVAGYQQIFTAGWRLTGGTDISNVDAFVVKLEEAPIGTTLQP